ncbi:aldo/keto reductase [Deferrisoma camini]|uniref:aldo/keto reductase n=1 Tax=Deferrisoma camini TaxID=1035120 RepID=UPI00046C9F34|nr:aldo/keto reductase [Deferrisoma camini]
MNHRILGRTGLRVSALGLGCMRLPTVGGDETRIDEAAAGALVRRALELGVNYLDTAYPYHGGESERFLGRVLAEGLRDRVLLADKMPPWFVNEPADLERIFGEQLDRLRTDRIDLYLLHSLNRRFWKRFRELGALEFLERKRREGRVRFVGFSFHDRLPVFREIVDAYDWDFCQVQYNYMDEEVQAGTEGLRYAAHKGLGVVVMEPLRGGRLARAEGRGLSEIWQGTDPAAAALRWVWSHPEVSVVLSGMGRVAELVANARAADRSAEPLGPDLEERIRRAREWYRQRVRVPCTYCQYCLPCPEGVNIPRVFELVNDANMFEDWSAVRRRYQRFTPADERADNCVACGACEEVCPQGISIIQELQKAHEELG